MDVAAWVGTAAAWVLLSAVMDWLVAGDDDELVAVVTIGALEMTDVVFVAPTVVPLVIKVKENVRKGSFYFAVLPQYKEDKNS